MCGIVGILGKAGTNVSDALITSLKRLEYRGYDSAGIALLSQGAFYRHRASGKLENLETLQTKNPLPGHCGIAHTRWATHGIPNEANAHPHMTERVALVHNGIIENHEEFRPAFASSDIQFQSATDTEVVLHLIDQALISGLEPVEAVRTTLEKLKGAYAFAFLFREYPDLMIGVRYGPPLAVGYGQGEMYLGSDATALAPLTKRLSYLEDGDMAVLTPHSVKIFNLAGTLVQRPIREHSLAQHLADKGNFSHFMAKEIHEQPQVIRQTLENYLNADKSGLQHPPLPFNWQDISRITIVACGTAYYAGLVAKYWFESIARLPVEIDIASEFRYRTPPLIKGDLAIFISQSGETADTLAAQAYAKTQEQHCLAVVNVPESSLARAVDCVFMTHAGTEIGVASTKAFTTQLSVLAVLAIAAAQARQTISQNDYQHHCMALAQIPALMDEVLLCEHKCREIAYQLSKARDILYLGRGTSYAIAMEGALKLKEISYIHAEGYAAGELKHGPIALIDDTVPVIAIAPSDALFEKTASNIQEVAARKGRVILISDAEGHEKFPHPDFVRLTLPATSPLLSPILYALPVQMLAYHTAVIKGTDVDQPRNLAKSVTVE
ncbi:glutamine--fructose-6-phosphate aminotransferase [Caedimonas varicaedens]|uniref:Glutamine--fructose-6-phosphate aminotransferase [isomerizing] n=1 Tax=Caedimonas varicaedens TaxID=1629334 RepID=A0A0K8MEL5_9PROT|nr:glutamine--fructose-6-phosphate aminotransferase [Caedimonas varicaedens]